MKNGELSVRERDAFIEAANEGARAALIPSCAAFDARQLAEGLATTRHGVRPADVEKTYAAAKIRQSALIDAIRARWDAFDEASAHFKSSPYPIGGSAVLALGNVPNQIASVVNWIEALLGLPAVVLRVRCYLNDAQCLQLSKTRDELSVSLDTYTRQVETIYALYKNRAEALKKKS